MNIPVVRTIERPESDAQPMAETPVPMRVLWLPARLEALEQALAETDCLRQEIAVQRQQAKPE